MTKNKSSQQIQKASDALKKEMAALQNKQVRLNLLHQVQRQGVTRSVATWFVAGNSR